jgi:hypothetical protein
VVVQHCGASDVQDYVHEYSAADDDCHDGYHDGDVCHGDYHDVCRGDDGGGDGDDGDDDVVLVLRVLTYHSFKYKKTHVCKKIGEEGYMFNITMIK